MRQALVFHLFYLFLSPVFGAVPIDILCSDSERISDEWVVRWKNSFENLSAAKFHKVTLLDSSKSLGLFSELNKKSAPFQNTVSVSRVHTSDQNELEQLAQDPRVLSIESNCRVHLMALPNDPDLGKNIGFDMIRMSGAWNYAHDSSVIVAVPDTGIEITHPDLASNIWKNERELSGVAGVDDDQNGYVDDFYGWNFAEENNDVTPGTYSGAEHGTHVAGIIGATGNNGLGSTGIAWKIKMMTLRPFQKTQEVATSADLIESINYAVRNGAQIINCSWGSQRDSSLAELEAFKNAEAAGVLVVAASGHLSIDAALFSPAGIPTVFAVGSVNSARALSSFSSFGPKIGSLAPGGDIFGAFGSGLDEGIYSTILGGYGLRRGTSMSAPFVTGVAALVKSLLPNLKPSELRKLISETGDQYSLRAQGQTLSYSVLNAEKALAIAQGVSNTKPNCSENCIASGSYANSIVETLPSHFGGGGCALVPNSKSASTGKNPWDLALLISFLSPFLMGLFKKKKPN